MVFERKAEEVICDQANYFALSYLLFVFTWSRENVFVKRTRSAKNWPDRRNVMKSNEKVV